SSDVCSSDLGREPPVAQNDGRAESAPGAAKAGAGTGVPTRAAQTLKACHLVVQKGALFPLRCNNPVDDPGSPVFCARRAPVAFLTDHVASIGCWPGGSARAIAS